MIDMPIWLIYSLIASLSVGCVNFIIKILIEESKNKFYFFFFSFLSLIIFSATAIVITNNDFTYTPDVVIFSFLFVLLYYTILNIRFISLKNILLSTYFIYYRSTLSLVLIIVGHIVFFERFRVQDYIGLIIGFVIFYLFYEREETKKGSNFKKGMKYLFIGVILAILLHTVSKYMMSSDIHLFSSLFFQGLFGILIMIFANITHLKNEIKNYPKKLRDILFFSVCGILNTIFLYFIFAAYEVGPIGIIYKVVAYSMFIPIVLSMLFYKEEINKKKFIGIILAIFSIFLFI